MFQYVSVQCLVLYVSVCECAMSGSTGDCDHRYGICVCKANVEGNNCDTCVANSYNISSGIGCIDCDCHPLGALDPLCDVVSHLIPTGDTCGVSLL